MSRFSTFFTTLREMLLLERAEERARALDDDRRIKIRELVEAAIGRLDAAASLGAPSTLPAACELFRTAIALLLEAHAIAHEGSPASVAARLAAHPELPNDPQIARAFEADSPLFFDALPAPELRELADALEHTANLLREGVETRTPRALRRARQLRLAILAAAVGTCFLLLLTPRARTENLALHKQVSASSVDPSSPIMSALVDGEAHGSYGARTAPDRSPWLLIDLGSTYAIENVVVYNRGDGFFDECLPLVVETSVDAQSFTGVGRRAEHFGQDDPWRLEIHGARGRYVRLRVDRGGYLALAEVEIFGHR